MGLPAKGKPAVGVLPGFRAGAGGCPPARLPEHSPIEVTPSGSPAKAGLGVTTWGKVPRGGPRD